MGTALGPYKITALVGVGGMGEVYRATDTKLGRAVAIKVLPETFARQDDRRARFQREAQLLASLNHPNIAAIYGLEYSDSMHYLVLELVEGENLAERLLRGPIPLEETIEIARQVAEGLEAAHDKGVVHRDLKPANVKLAPDGKVKLLDFGLAKVWMAGVEEDQSSDLSQSPTMARTSTEAGVILGTVSYMAPEQARGKAVDRRADIWAFGVVLWEMFTGRKLFEGESVSDILASVLTREPDWGALPPATPTAIRQLLRRTLERDVRRRLQAIGEARLVLENPDAATVESVAPRRRFLATVGGLALFAAGWFLRPTPQPTDSPIRKVDLSIADLDFSRGYSSNLNISGNQGRSPVISPDGSHLAYFAGGRLYLRNLTSFEAIEIPDSEEAVYPFWSPDGRQLAFVARGRAWKVATNGSRPTDLGAVPEDLVGSGGGAWTSDGRIVLSGSGTVGLWQLPAAGGDGTEILPLEPDSEADFHEIAPLPDNRGLVFTVHRADAGPDTIGLLADGTRRVLLQTPGESLRHPRYSSTGHLLYERETTSPGIWAAPFSLERLEVTGAPFLAVPGGMAPSDSGSVLSMVRVRESPVELVRVARNGMFESAVEVAKSRYRSGTMRLSPDGSRVALTLRQPTGHLWIYDLVRGSRSLVATDVFDVTRPVWTRDGERVLYASSIGARSWNLSARRVDAAGEEERISTSAEFQTPLAVSPDSRWLVYAGVFNLFKRPFDRSTDATPLVEGRVSANAASFSPDGRWLAYESDESGRFEIYARSFPKGDKRFQISSSGGITPVWCESGEIFYRNDRSLVAVTVSGSGNALEISKPAVMLEIESDTTAFDVTPDGQSFLLLRPRARERVSLIFNWPAEMARIAKESAAGTE